MANEQGPQAFKNILNNRQHVKPPSYQWQDLALRVIEELNIPNHKRNSAFKVCKQYTKIQIEKALNDTKELVSGEEKWKYFFKLLNNLTKQKIAEVNQQSKLKKSKFKAS